MGAPLTTNPTDQRSGIERLLGTLSAIYGAKFAQQWHGVDFEDLKATWVQALAGYTAEEIMRGVEACYNRPHAPTLPEFRALCRRTIDPESAYAEAQEQMQRREDGQDKWSHPAVYWAAVQYGHFELRNHTWATAAKRWTKLLNDLLADKTLPPVQERKAALPAPGTLSQTPEQIAEAKAAFRKLAAKLGGGKSLEAQVAEYRANPAVIRGLQHTAQHGTVHTAPYAAAILRHWGHQMEGEAAHG
jgi:hypothetical protein